MRSPAMYAMSAVRSASASDEMMQGRRESSFVTRFAPELGAQPCDHLIRWPASTVGDRSLASSNRCTQRLTACCVILVWPITGCEQAERVEDSGPIWRVFAVGKQALKQRSRSRRKLVERIASGHSPNIQRIVCSVNALATFSGLLHSVRVDEGRGATTAGQWHCSASQRPPHQGGLRPLGRPYHEAESDREEPDSKTQLEAIRSVGLVSDTPVRGSIFAKNHLDSCTAKIVCRHQPHVTAASPRQSLRVAPPQNDGAPVLDRPLLLEPDGFSSVWIDEEAVPIVVEVDQPASPKSLEFLVWSPGSAVAVGEDQLDFFRRPFGIQWRGISRHL